MTSDKLIEMLKLQDEINTRINPNWRAVERPWYRAIMHEVVEAQNHLGWKWWAKREPNLEAAKLELVDIWHFILSSYLDNGAEDYVSVAFDCIMKAWEDPIYPDRGDTPLDLLEALEGLTTGAAFAWAFRIVLDRAGMSFDELHRLYIGKNVLNAFRQANGYKQGTYSKVWADGREDNEHLNDLLDQGVRAEDLHAQLAMRYEPA